MDKIIWRLQSSEHEEKLQECLAWRWMNLSQAERNHGLLQTEISNSYCQTSVQGLLQRNHRTEEGF